MVFEAMADRGHERVVFCYDKETGLRAIIAIHNTTLGPALGGTRRLAYDTEADALNDVLRLSEAMTYKAAAGDLPMGGAKSVIWMRSADKPSTELVARAMGRMVDRLGGLYIAAEDVGVNTQFIDWMAQETKHVMGGETLARGGDPAPYTALGVISGMRGGLKHLGRSTSLKGLTIAVQGVGALGYNVCKIAAEEGANLIVFDIAADRVALAVNELGAKAVNSDAEILTAKCDILCPCALGGVVTANNISSLNCDILAPGANNVLGDPDEDATALLGAGIVYCPDFVNNGGGLIQLAGLWCGFSDNELNQRIHNIENVILKILGDAKASGSAHAAALAYARKRLDAGNKNSAHVETKSSQASTTTGRA